MSIQEALYRFIQKYHRTTAVLFGCFLALLILIFTETISHYFELKTNKTRKLLQTNHYPDGFWTEYDFNGIKHYPKGNYRVWSEDKQNQKVIFDVNYTIDQFGRRQVPAQAGKKDKFAIFLGCSFTFGLGVNDNENLPYYFGTIAKKFMPYNYGIPAGGPFTFLAQIENYDFGEQIKEKNGILIYTFIDNHIPRIMPRWLLSYQEKYFYEETKKGKFIKRPINESVKFNFYKVLLKSSFFRSLKSNEPRKKKDEEIALTARLVEAMSIKFLEKYPDGKFYLVIYPKSSYGKKLTSHIAKKNINIIDLSKLFDHFDTKKYFIPIDGHPTNLAYQTVAKEIAEKINQDFEENTVAEGTASIV